MKKDIEIAQAAKMKSITEVADSLGIGSDALGLYGNYMAKVDPAKIGGNESKAKTVLVTAMTPTPAGEGKTTVTIGLSDAFNRLGVKSVAALREPSLGPVFGMKGGATGGGYAQLLPMTEINLHFTGDIHAVGSAHNLLAAVTDNEYAREKRVCLIPRNVFFNRVMDMNDRSLRNIVLAVGEQSGQVRQGRFDITASSEVMAILGLSRDLTDLKERLGLILVGEEADGSPIYASDLGVQGAMTILLRDAIKPNLVQTLEGNGALVHTGPFANIAHGTNSMISTTLARRISDVAVVEAGFGSDLGGEKYFNLVSRMNHTAPPDAVVVVATVRALKYHGGKSKRELSLNDPEAVERGMPNLIRHLKNMASFGRSPFVALNIFKGDSIAEIEKVHALVEREGFAIRPVEVWEKGGEGAVSLARAVMKEMERPAGEVRYTYELDDSLETKIEKIAKSIYGAGSVKFHRSVKKRMAEYAGWGYGNLPVCMAKTQYSFSDNSKLRGAPEGFSLEVVDIRLSSGAGFVVVFLNDIMTMPGLPETPAALNMDIDSEGKISGLF